MKKCNKYIVRVYMDGCKQIDMVVKSKMDKNAYYDVMCKMWDWEYGMTIDVIPVK